MYVTQTQKHLTQARWRKMMSKYKWIVWVGGVDDYYVHYVDAKRDYDDWIDKGYDNVIIEENKDGV